MKNDDIRDMLQLAHESLTVAIACADSDVEAAIDDMVAARLRIATVLLGLQPASTQSVSHTPLTALGMLG